MATYPSGKRYPEIDAEDVSSGIFALGRIPTPLTGKDADTVDGKNPASASGLATLDASSKVVQDPATSFIPLAQKAAASGVASLGATSLVVQKPADRLGIANLEFTLNKLLKGAGVGVSPTEIDVPPTRPMTNGYYSGDSTVDRAIAHGLGVLPQLVLIRCSGSGIGWFCLFYSLHALMSVSSTWDAIYTVTTATTTNFYVGDALDYTKSANLLAEAYEWVAIG